MVDFGKNGGVFVHFRVSGKSAIFRDQNVFSASGASQNFAILKTSGVQICAQILLSKCVFWQNVFRACAA